MLAATNGYGHMREINETVAEVFGDHGEQLYEVFGIETGEARLRAHFSSIVWHAFDNDLVGRRCLSRARTRIGTVSGMTDLV